MLSDCISFVIASSAQNSLELERVAERIGFGAVSSARRPVADQRGRLPFFLLHYQLSDAAMRAAILEVRGAEHDDTRYAPIILISDDCPVGRLLHYIKLGFDDVIALPEKREILESRIAAQLHADQHYYETPDYLGPDRRRMEVPGRHDDRRTGTTPYYQLTIRRDPIDGISVLRRQMIGQQHRPQPDASTHFMPRLFTPGAAAARFSA